MQPVFSPPPVSPSAVVPGLRKLGTGSTDAAAGNDPRFSALTGGVVANVAALRAITNPGTLTYRTLGYTTARDSGSASYYWDATATDADDGVLVIKATAIAIGRFRWLGAGSITATACGFDRTGTTPLGTQLYITTALLRAAGIKSLIFPAGTYTIHGEEQIAPSTSPYDSFTLEGEPGARMVAIAAPSPTQGGCGIRMWAWGNGDTPNENDQSTCIDPNSPLCVGFTMAVVGGENVLTGFSSTSGVTVGSTVILYIGAELTDAGGWPNSFLMATVLSKTSNTVTIDRVLPQPTPIPSTNTGINAIRTSQNNHTLRTVIGFQDNLTIKGFSLWYVSLNPLFCRYFIVDCFWEVATFGVNATCTLDMSVNFRADIVTGYDTGGGGAFSHYGGGIILNNCYGTFIPRYEVAYQDGVVGISEELSSRGTHIGLIDVLVDSSKSPTGATFLVAAIGGATNLISVDHILLRGVNGKVDLHLGARIGTLEARGSTAQQYITIRGDQCNNILVRGQEFSCLSRHSEISIPLPTAPGTYTYTLPDVGFVRRMALRATSLTGVTDIFMFGGSSGTQSSIRGFLVGANVWYDISYAAMVCSPGSFNFNGASTPQIIISVDGTVPVGQALMVDIDVSPVYVPDGFIGQPVNTNNTLPKRIVTNGPPAVSAGFISQDAYDSTNRRLYQAVTAGNASADWVVVGSSGAAAMPVIGTVIPDADTSISVSAGSHYFMPTVTANRIVTLLDTGSPITGESIIVDVTRKSAFTVTIKDAAGTTLLVVPASVPMTVTASYNGTHFAAPQAIRITP